MYTRRLILAAVLVLAALAFVGQQASACPDHGMMTPGMQGRGPMQHGMHRGMHGMMSLDQLTTALNLTPDQVSKIQAIQQNARVQRQAVLADKSLTPEARRAKLMDLARTNHQQMMAVLTPEQQAKWQQLHAQRRAERFGKMSTALGLTADQQAQIKAIKDKEKADIKAVLADTSLTREAKAAQVKQIRTTAKAQIRALLTPEQQQKLDELYKSKAGKAGAGPRMLRPRAVQPKAVPQY